MTVFSYLTHFYSLSSYQFRVIKKKILVALVSANFRDCQRRKKIMSSCFSLVVMICILEIAFLSSVFLSLGHNYRYFKSQIVYMNSFRTFVKAIGSKLNTAQDVFSTYRCIDIFKLIVLLIMKKEC